MRIRNSTIIISLGLGTLCVVSLAVIVSKARGSLRNYPEESQGDSLPQNPAVTKIPRLAKAAKRVSTSPIFSLKLARGVGNGRATHFSSTQGNPDAQIVGDSDSRTVPSTENDDKARDFERTSGHFSYYDSAIKSQTPDPVWANNLADAVRAQYQGIEGVTVDSVECGETLCRLEMGTTADDPHGERAMSNLHKVEMIKRSEVSPGMTSPPLPPKAIIYVSREGNTLPMLQ